MSEDQKQIDLEGEEVVKSASEPVKSKKKAKKKVVRKSNKNSGFFSVTNKSGITQNVAGVTIKSGETKQVPKRPFLAYSRGSYGHSLLSKNLIESK